MINAQSGNQLLLLARDALTCLLKHGETAVLQEEELAPALRRHASTFVTIYSYAPSGAERRLRGCIGSIHARLPLANDVTRNTVAAARDPRFEPVQARELPDLRIQVAVLHPTRPLNYSSYDDLIACLHPGVDGVIVSWRDRQALLLPQVWERLDCPVAFLQALCHKAHIPWQYLASDPPQVQVATFLTTTFGEPYPPVPLEDKKGSAS